MCVRLATAAWSPRVVSRGSMPPPQGGGYKLLRRTMSLSGLLLFDNNAEYMETLPTIQVNAIPCKRRWLPGTFRWFVEFHVEFPGRDIPFHFESFDTHKATLAQAVNYTMDAASSLETFFFYYLKKNPETGIQELIEYHPLNLKVTEEYLNNLTESDLTGPFPLETQ